MLTARAPSPEAVHVCAILGWAVLPDAAHLQRTTPFTSTLQEKPDFGAPPGPSRRAACHKPGALHCLTPAKSCLPMLLLLLHGHQDPNCAAVALHCCHLPIYHAVWAC